MIVGTEIAIDCMKLHEITTFLNNNKPVFERLFISIYKNGQFHKNVVDIFEFETIKSWKCD